MSPEMITLIMFASMIALLVTGRQIFVILAAIGIFAGLALWGVGGISMAFYSTMKLISWYSLLAIPCFIFMGYILAGSGVAQRLYDAMHKWVGAAPGGLAMGTIGICSLIAAMAGLLFAGTVTSAYVALPEMLKRKYHKHLAAGTIMAGGALGFLIPPSIVFILYGLIARVSIGHLWLAGVFPGILLAGMYIAYIGIRCRFQPDMGPALPPEERVGWGEKFRSLGAGIAPIILIFLVLGLLFMGVTSITESGAVAAAGALACAAINRRLTRKLFMDALGETSEVSAMLMWIVVGSFVFAAVYDGLGAVYAIEHLFSMIGIGGKGGIILMMVTFGLMGMVLDDTAMLLIVAPLFIPLVRETGFSLVWFGVLYTLTVEMAMMSPPFGYSLFILKGVLPKGSGITITDLYKSSIPFIGVQAACLAIIFLFPQIALWLPNLVFGG